MSFSLITEYPWYFILFCLLLGALYAFLSYQKSNLHGEGRRWGWPVWMLALMRFLSVSILAFLLLSPVVKSLFTRREKPVIILAADNSQSVLLNKDSNYYRTEFRRSVNALEEKLSEKYDVRRFTFGANVSDKDSLNFSEKQTDLSGLYDKVYNMFYNQNIGAVITLSDGIYNVGQHPGFAAQKFNAPFYTVALGDTIPQRDVLIRDVQYNQIVYTGNFFPLQVQLRAKGYSGQEVRLSVSQKGKVLFNQPVHIDNASFYQEIPVRIEATVPGMQHYHVEVSRLDGEISYVNNSFEVFIDVLDSKKKILLVCNAPHPDVSAIRSAIERNAYYEVNTWTFDEYQKAVGNDATKLRNYQLAILHQLPSASQTATAFTEALKESDVPVLYILGAQSNIGAFNNLEAGLRIQGGGNRLNDAQPALNTRFSLFSVSEDLSRAMPQWPPLQTPFGDYRPAGRDQILLHQQIGRVTTEIPLLMFGTSGKRKVGVLCGEGVWRWVMADYAADQNFKATDELISKSIQYLSVKTDSRLFRVRPSKNLFFEDEKVSFEAEVYNQSYEPIPNAQVQMKIRNEAGKEFNYTFQPRGAGYFLDAGFMPAGAYTYTSSTTIGGKPYTLNGEFIVKKVELEYLETVANHSLLNSLAVQQGGKMVYPRDMDKLAEMIESREDIKPVAYQQTEFRDLIHFKWLFFLVLALLSVEWFLRKYFGAT